MKIKQIGFVNTPIYDNDEGMYPPLGLLSIASYIKNVKQLSVNIYDVAIVISIGKIEPVDIYNDLTNSICKNGEQVVGITCQNYSLAAALCIAKAIKKRNPNIWVFLGGVGTHGISEQLLQIFDYIDFIVYGEGECVVGELIDAIENSMFEDIKGVYYRTIDGDIRYNGNQNLIADLNELPMPDFSLLDALPDYFSLIGGNRRALNVELARGCSGGCAFCGSFSFWSGRHRYFDISKVFDQITQLIEDYQISHVYLSDDNFMTNKIMVKNVCNEFISRELKVTWDSRGRVDDMNPDLLELMHKAGCTEILIGIESADDQVLKKMNKKIVSAQQIQAVENVMNAGILPILSLILGYEDETEDGINKTFSLLLELYRKEKPMVSYFHILSIVPGTHLYNREVKHLMDENIDDILENLRYAKKSIPSEEKELIKQFPEIFCTFYHLPTNIDYKVLKCISDFSTEIFKVFCFTLSLIEKTGGNIVRLFSELAYSGVKEVDKSVEQFANVIYQNYHDNMWVRNMLLHEMIINRLAKSKEGTHIKMKYDVDILALKEACKSPNIGNEINRKVIYNYQKQEEKITLYEKIKLTDR
ncbi:B12-binding domain-containing radical SAM protein [Acetivibrio ethanolgignens]|uniref:Uncharacterized protein n=1 Tax=Acetivibrio ethanolgignens TaxID=290052 RepID=A0A0V8QKL1_9FIRM|nr:radical SAM protein [Acetivibrio ethanolgignens]KSV60729.1 hypothetical protein ASU35_00745 [Acetivibrio ethanolgignens]